MQFLTNHVHSQYPQYYPLLNGMEKDHKTACKLAPYIIGDKQNNLLLIQLPIITHAFILIQYDCLFKQLLFIIFLLHTSHTFIMLSTQLIILNPHFSTLHLFNSLFIKPFFYHIITSTLINSLLLFQHISHTFISHYTYHHIYFMIFIPLFIKFRNLRLFIIKLCFVRNSLITSQICP